MGDKAAAESVLNELMKPVASGVALENTTPNTALDQHHGGSSYRNLHFISDANSKPLSGGVGSADELSAMSLPSFHFFHLATLAKYKPSLSVTGSVAAVSPHDHKDKDKDKDRVHPSPVLHSASKQNITSSHTSGHNRSVHHPHPLSDGVAVKPHGSASGIGLTVASTSEERKGRAPPVLRDHTEHLRQTLVQQNNDVRVEDLETGKDV
eukprot:gene6043-7711_t